MTDKPGSRSGWKPVDVLAAIKVGFGTMRGNAGVVGVVAVRRKTEACK
jgi:hypothetical protein